MKNVGAALGATAIAITGIYGIYYLSGGTTHISTTLEFEDVQKLKASDSPIVQKYFSGLVLDNNAPDSLMEPKMFEAKSTDENPIKGVGCVIVNGTKAKADESKGTFRLNWGIKRGNEGLLVFTKVEKDLTEENKVFAKGISYKLEKKDGKGTVVSKRFTGDSTNKKYYRDITSETDKSFPAVGEALVTNKLILASYGGFSSTVKGDTTTSYQKSGTGEETNKESDKTFDKGSYNFKDGGSNLFGRSWTADETIILLKGVGTEQ